MEINRTVTRCETLLLIIIIRDYSCGQLHRPPSVVIRRSLGLDPDPPDPESHSSPAGEDSEVKVGKVRLHLSENSEWKYVGRGDRI